MAQRSRVCFGAPFAGDPAVLRWALVMLGSASVERFLMPQGRRSAAPTNARR